MQPEKVKVQAGRAVSQYFFMGSGQTPGQRSRTLLVIVAIRTTLECLQPSNLKSPRFNLSTLIKIKWLRLLLVISSVAGWGFTAFGSSFRCWALSCQKAMFFWGILCSSFCAPSFLATATATICSNQMTENANRQHCSPHRRCVCIPFMVITCLFSTKVFTR